MHVPSIDAHAPSRKRFLIPLIVAVFAAAVIDILIPISTLDMAQSFNVPPGTVGQLNSLVAIASVVTALLFAGFGARFRYKTLLVFGVLFVASCSVGLFLAPTFWVAQLVVSLNGIGSVLVTVTALTFIGNSYPLDKKAKAVGWVTAAGTLAIAVGSPIVGFMTSAGGWRTALLLFMLPTAVISLVFVLLAFSHDSSQQPATVKRVLLVNGFKQILANKSAMALLASSYFGNAFSAGGAVFEVTFLRQVFSAPPSLAAIAGPLMGAVFITVGAIFGGHVVNRFGRKRLNVVSVFAAGLFVLLSYSMSNIVTSLILRWTAAFSIGVTATAASNLVLEQVPQFRGTAMALASAFRGVGFAFGIAVAGAVLNFYVDATTGFQMLGFTVAALAFTSGLITLFLANDPFRTGSAANFSRLFFRNS